MLRQIFLLLLAGLTAQAQTRPTPTLPPDMAAFMEGSKLSQDQVSAIEKTLDSFPDDLNAHVKLLGYYSMGKNAEDDEHSDFAKYLLWMVDHRPESVVFEIGIIGLNWEPSPTLWDEYRKHWEQAATAHPKDSAVLSRTAEVVSDIDPILGLAYARKSLEADRYCTDCRNMLGTIIGNIILRLSRTPRGWKGGGWEWKCLPNTSDVEQTVSDLRQEIESSNDPEILLEVGMTLEGWAGHSSKCGVNSEEAVHFGGELIRKAVGLDPSLIDRRHLQNVLQSIETRQQQTKTGEPQQSIEARQEQTKTGEPQQSIERRQEQAKTGEPQIQRAGVNGVGVPLCLYCRPIPDYTDKARKAKVQGTIVVRVVVTIDGRAEHISVIKGLGFGLDENAMEAVKKWRFKPAHDADGHPVAAITPMEITFRIP